MTLRVLRTAADVIRTREALGAKGDRLALVPTMGFLHEGHLSLMREGRRRSGAVAASIFVNPTQFGPKEDLARYPRDLDGDLAKCESAGVEWVFVPEVSTLYPPGYQTYVEVEGVSQGLCGARRPGHFRGVATIVTQLFCLFRPQLALFGEKDYQQLQVIKALARDLHLGVEVVGMPTVREADGLAMSSRNAYLNPEERQRSLALYRGLSQAQALARAGERQVEVLVSAVRAELTAARAREDYVAGVDAETLEPLAERSDARPARMLVAAYLGPTRLIDNVPL